MQSVSIILTTGIRYREFNRWQCGSLYSLGNAKCARNLSSRDHAFSSKRRRSSFSCLVVVQYSYIIRAQCRNRLILNIEARKSRSVPKAVNPRNVVKPCLFCASLARRCLNCSKLPARSCKMPAGTKNAFALLGSAVLKQRSLPLIL